MKKSSKTGAMEFKVIDVDEIKKPRIGNFVIHVSKSKWDKAIKDIPVVPYNKKRFGKLTGVSFTPVNPSNPDLGVFVFPDPCKNGCVKKIMPDALFGRCDCPPDISTPSPGGSGHPNFHLHECHVTIWRGIVQCLGSNCVGCTPQLIPVIKVGKQILLGYFVCKCK
jgi:hypothetical protein